MRGNKPCKDKQEVNTLKEEKEKFERKYINEEAAAEFLGISARTLRDWRLKGQINNKGEKPPKAYVRGKHIFFEIHELDAWVREGATNCSDEEPRRRRGAH